MKILLKRNSSSDSIFENQRMDAGEPIWFKDKLYIGSVGSTAGGTGIAGTKILIGPYTGNNGITVDTNGTIKHANTYAAKTSGLYKITVDDFGHISAATAVAKSDITALGIPGTDTNTTYTAGTGLTLSGTTFNHTNSVTAVTSEKLFKFKYDAQGHITETVEVGKSDITALGIPEANTHLAHTITFTNGNTTSNPNGDSVAVITGIENIQTSTTNGDDTVALSRVNVPTTTYVDNQLAELKTAVGNPMVFKGSFGTGGTVTILPTDPKVGDTYKVITETEISNVGTAKVGDTIIRTSNGWVIIPSGDEPSGTVTSVDLTVPTGLTVNGSPITSSGTLAITLDSDFRIPKITDLYSYGTINGDTGTTTANSPNDTLTIAGTAPISTVASTDTLAISHDNSGVNEGSYPRAGAQATYLDYTSTFDVPKFTVDAKGHLTVAGSVAYKLPDSDNTDTKVTEVGNHYTPSGGTNLTPTVSSTGEYALGTEYTVVTDVKITKDAAGHITGASVTKQKIKDTNTDTNDTYSFSTTATNGKFAVTTTGSSHAVTLTEIDGGTF